MRAWERVTLGQAKIQKADLLGLISTLEEKKKELGALSSSDSASL